MENQNVIKAAPKRVGVKTVKITAEFTVVLADASILGGKAANILTKTERYANFYLRHALKDLSGVVIKQEEVK